MAGVRAVMAASEQHHAVSRGKRRERRFLHRGVHLLDVSQLRGRIAQIDQPKAVQFTVIAGGEAREEPAQLRRSLRGSWPASAVDDGAVVGIAEKRDRWD